MKKLNNYFKIISKFAKELYIFLLGLFWISFYFYIRLILERHAYTLQNLQENLNLSYFYFCIIFILMHLIILVLAIKNILQRSNNTETSSRLSIKIERIFDTFYNTPLIYIRDLLIKIFPKIDNIFFYTMEYFSKITLKIKIDLSKFLVITLFFLPRIVVSSIFFIELVFYNRIYYFIPCLIFLIVPILWRVFINMMHNCGTRGMTNLVDCIDIYPIGIKNTNGIHDSYLIKEKPDYFYPDGVLEEYAKTWRICLKLVEFSGSFIMKFQHKIGPYITIFCSSCYIMGSFYKLIFLLL